MSRFIKTHTNKNFKDIIFEKKLEAICLMLVDINLPIVEILNQNGIYNETYFYKRFKKIFGITPQIYRESKKHLINSVDF
ncbi:MAG: helix-turn-helix domain-containing protein [Erysipelotrichaceae bacterium]|nr:helix-turn-helix domain-containing protein [Erysipelotrichaceae bacterium]